VTAASSDRKTQKLVRRLVRLAEDGNADAFAKEIATSSSRQLILGCRRAKILMRADKSLRQDLADMLKTSAGICMEATEFEEFERYVSFSLAAADAREKTALLFNNAISKLPRLSRRQMMEVANRFVRKHMPDWPDFLEGEPVPELVAENERRLHNMSGYSNDLSFAVARVINHAWPRCCQTDLRRADALSSARAPFQEATRLASQLTALDYTHDSASFGHFLVSGIDEEKNSFQLDIVDIRLNLIRILASRRRMTAILTGNRGERFLRDALRAVGEGVAHNALVRAMKRAGKGPPAQNDFELLERVLDQLLLEIGASDDLLVAASKGNIQLQMLYHMALALRINAAALKLAALQLGPRARLAFDRRISLTELLEDISDPQVHAPACEAWNSLTIELPARSYWDTLNKPFARTGESNAFCLMLGDTDSWASQVRNLAIKGGETGRQFGHVWEDFITRGFADTGWQIVGRNIRIVVDGSPVTEVDLLLLRDDLLLVVEIKALAGVGMNPYDHWKNRETIERGCRQAKLAAARLEDNRTLLVSITNRQIAARVKLIQPLVLTNESMFDGWEHEGVPVAGETIRKAITQGTKVEYYDGHSGEFYRTDWHLRPEELNTTTILHELQNPIELKLAPERGDVQLHGVEVAGLTVLIPDLSVGSLDVRVL
jgi:Holliday junction resolvase-like predicted endonuclease